jgi:tripartite-type tricarboxylate transporter receptor subunit TctC
VARSAPDGYSLLFGSDIIWLGPLLRGQPDVIREFSPLSLLASAPNILVVHPSLPVKSVKELIALAKARPGELNYSSSGAGSTDHIAGELFKNSTGTNIVWIPFKGSGAAAVAVAAGEVQVMFGGVFLVSPYIKSGRLRALAVTSVQPSALAIGLPTIAASGIPGYELVSTDSMYAPANTPPAIINQLNQEIVRFLRTKEAQEKYLALGSEVVASSPEEHAAQIKSRIATIGKLIKDAGIKVE